MRQTSLISVLFIVMAIATFGAYNASAQGAFGAQTEQAPAISWRGTARLTTPDEGVITLTATMAEGWHLYGMEMPQDGPRPTSFAIEPAEGLTLIGDMTANHKPILKHDAMFNTDVQFWEGKVVFTQRFKLNKKEGSVEKIRCTVNYMGCNDATCLPPKKKDFTLKILPKK